MYEFKILRPWHKPMTTGFKNNDTETNTLDVEKIKNRRKQNFEDEATNMMQQDKEDTQ